MILHSVSGVPQGSVLGPLLFYIYIDDISTISFSEGSTFNLFADDMFLYKVIKSPEDLIWLCMCRSELPQPQPTRNVNVWSLYSKDAAYFHVYIILVANN